MFLAAPVGDAWDEVASELTAAFGLTKRAAGSGAPVLYVAHSADLLGQGGAGRAMVACGLLSGTRVLALEGRKRTAPANFLAIEPASEPGAVARWSRRLLERGGPTGELVRLGSSHVGRALP